MCDCIITILIKSKTPNWAANPTKGAFSLGIIPSYVFPLSFFVSVCEICSFLFNVASSISNTAELKVTT